MANILTVPESGIYFDGNTAGTGVIPVLTGNASGVAIQYDDYAGITISSSATGVDYQDRFSVEGANGRLFGVSDQIVGSVFSVNDAAGLPLIDVEVEEDFSKINLGQFGTDALVISGSSVQVTGSNVVTQGYLSDQNYMTTADETYSTSAELLAALLGVHGAGSNLDSDKLDGQHGSYYLNYNNFSNTPTIPSAANNTTITLSGGTDITTSIGNFTTNQSSPETLTINHANVSRSNTTSTASPAFGSTFTVVDGVTSNARGHVTAENVKTITLPSLGTTASTALAGNTTVNDVSAANLKSRLAAFTSADTIYIGDSDDDTTVVIRGTLQVDGTTTTVNSTTITVDDKNIELGSIASPTDALADGGGITLKGTTDKTINWLDSSNAWTFSDRIAIPYGNESAPSLTFSSSTNTGIYGASTFLRLVVGGVWKASIASNGITSNGFIKTGGTSSEFLKADGSVDTTTYLTAASTQSKYLRSDADDTTSGTITIQGMSKSLRVGDISGDNYTEIKHTGSNGYGFTYQHGNASVLLNQQGTTNEVVVLGDVSAGNTTTLFGIGHSTNGGSSWTPKLNFRGDAELFIGSSATSRVFHDGYHPNADTLTTARTIAGESFDGSSDIDISYNNLTNKPTLGTAAAAASTDFATAAQGTSAETAYDDRYKWDGGSTGLTAATGRTSLGLGSAATSASSDFASASHTHAASAITSGTLDAARIPSLAASKITSGTFSSDRIAHNSFDIGDTTAETGRSVHETGIYTFNRNNGNLGTGTASGYYSVLAFGQGAGGSAQIASSWTGGGNNLYYRSLRDTLDDWYAWKQIWHSGSDGAGSGLDADLLDGNHASAFATSAQGTKADNALPKAGGTMSGALNTGGNAFGGTYLSVNSGGVTQWGSNRGILTWDTGHATIYAASTNELRLGAGGASDNSIVLDGSSVAINKPITTTSTVTATGGNSTNWNTAYGWGNHASANYITGNQTITLSGDVSGSGTTSISVSLAADSVGSAEIADNAVVAAAIAANAVGASELNVSGNGTTAQFLRSDGDGTFTWATPTDTDTVYTHPTHAGDDINIDTGALTGATVISDLDFNITTNTLGHVTDANGSVSTRTLTAANLGISAPNAPTSLSATIVGETIDLTFTASTTSNIDAYLVYSSVDGGDYGLIQVIPPDDFSATMSVIDSAFSVTGTQAYRVYAMKYGILSTAGTASVSYTLSTVEPTNMSVINMNCAYFVQWDPPSSNDRFVSAYNVYKHEHATQGSLSRSSASLIYSGLNTNYMYQISGNNNNNFHQFWVETTIA